MITRLGCLAVSVLVAVSAAEASAAASWRTLVATSANLREPPVLIGDPAGGALLAWTHFVGDQPQVGIDVGAPSGVWATWRPAGAEPTTPQRVTAPDEQPRALAGAGDGRGGLLLAWRDGERRSGDLRVAAGTTATGVGAPVSLRGAGRLPRAEAHLGGLIASRPAVALAARGDAIVAWLTRERRGCGYSVRAAVRPRGQARFGRGRLVSPPCARAANPRVALNARGVGAIAWDEGPVCLAAAASCRHAVVTARIRRGRIGQTRVVTRTATPQPVALAAGAGGETLAWRSFEQQTPDGVLGHVMATSANRSPRAISRNLRAVGSPVLAAGPAGTMLATWQSGFPVSGSGRVWVAVRAPGERAFAATETLSAGVADGRVAHLAAALDGGGSAAVLHCSAGLRLVLDVRAAGGARRPTELVGGSVELAQSPCSGSPIASRLAVSAAGDVLVALYGPAGRLTLVERPGPLS